MAKVAGPLLSLSASGKFANTLVASVWKGIPYMRQYVVPANPQTTAQVAHRALFTAGVSFWQMLKAVAVMKTAWGVEALVSPDTQSGFNAFMQNYMKMVKEDADASFINAFTDTAGVPSFDLVNADNEAEGDETGDFLIWRGTTKSNLAYIETKTIAAGTITGTIAPTAGTYFYKVVKDNGASPAVDISRGGIMELLNEVP